MDFDIPSGAGWASVAPVNKGWSSDRKYRVRTREGEDLLLRLSDIGQYDAKRREYAIIGRYSRLGFAMSMPREFGVCEGGRSVYMLLTWVEGADLEDALPTLPEPEQYRLGREAGGILRRIHSVPVAAEDRPAQSKKARKLEQLSRYEASRVRIDGDGAAIRFVRDNIDSIWRQPPVCQHGDFHPGNLILRPDGSLGVIDFNRWEVGDPYEEFYKLQSFGREVSVPYCAGQIDAYFEDAVPGDFWPALAVYVAQASLFSITWAEKFGPADVAGMVRRCRAALDDYDGFRAIVPKWYAAYKEI